MDWSPTEANHFGKMSLNEHISNRLTCKKAPYHLNQHPADSVLSLPMINQESVFFTKLMNVDDTAFLVLKLVFRHHNSAWKLAATCQQMWRLISKNVVSIPSCQTLVQESDTNAGHLGHDKRLLQRLREGCRTSKQ
jgi:hypothetical protein